MRDISMVFLIVGVAAGWLLSALLLWQMAVAILRLVLAAHTPASVALLLGRLADATRAGAPFAPALRALRLQMPWPWPWRLGRAAARLEAGEDAAAVLASSGLLPRALRAQAAAALRQGPEAFAVWCGAVTDQRASNPLAVQSFAFVLAEVAAMLAVVHFLSLFIFPKFEWIYRDLGVQVPASYALVHEFLAWEPQIVLVLVAAAVGGWFGILALRWRRRRRLAAGRLLLLGSEARLPEAAMGGADFASLCASAGWAAATPAELGRALVRAGDREALRAAWLPAVLAACAPLIAALPVAALTYTIFELLWTVIIHVAELP